MILESRRLLVISPLLTAIIATLEASLKMKYKIERLATAAAATRPLRLTFLLLGAIAAGFFPLPARAGIQYSFSFTPSDGSIHSFAVSFTVNAFVTSGESPAFSRVTMTDGVNSDSLTTDLAENQAGFFCFNFGAAANNTLFADCGTNFSTPNGGVLVALFSGASLPTAPGTFTDNSAIASFYYGASPSDRDLSDGTVQLTVSRVPEPSSVILMASMFLAAAFAARKRIARG